jgi:hypothetical protein
MTIPPLKRVLIEVDAAPVVPGIGQAFIRGLVPF